METIVSYMFMMNNSIIRIKCVNFIRINEVVLENIGSCISHDVPWATCGNSSFGHVHVHAQ